MEQFILMVKEQSVDYNLTDEDKFDNEFTIIRRGKKNTSW